MQHELAALVFFARWQDKSPMLLWHFGENLPSIDVIQKRAIVASLGGEAGWTGGEELQVVL